MAQRDVKERGGLAGVSRICDDWRMTARDSECVICRSGAPSAVIAGGASCWVTAPECAPLPGYVCVVSKMHAVEPFDLPQGQQAAFWLDVCSVARAVRDAAGSSKINDEIHGNTIPRLHLHVFPSLPERSLHRGTDRRNQPTLPPLPSRTSRARCGDANGA
jgi:diadenosine tetraphosphate (Ap4A) HIT family hydrolase